jgi:putative ABC transport system permease protein
MKLLSTFNTAVGALSVNQGRTALTSLGITIGIAAVIAMVSAGQGAQSEIDNIFGSIGPNLVVAFSGTTSSSGLRLITGPVFSQEEAEAIRTELGELITGCSEVSQHQTTVSSKSNSTVTAVAGGMPEVFKIRRWKPRAGRFYSDDDVKRQSNVAVLGKTVSDKLFPNMKPEQIIGQSIRIGRQQRFQVVGLLEEKGSTPAGDQDAIIMIPITTLLRKLTGSDKCSLILAEARSAELVDQVRDGMERIIRSHHRIRPGQEDDFNVRPMREYANIAGLITDTLRYLIFAVASISLVVGGIGVMNIMLVSVTERTREIGIRMAVGARTWDILGQFLTEAVILALIGGFIGIMLGAGAAWMIARYLGWTFVVEPLSVVVAVLTSAGVGIFFGYYPARKASLLDPIEALRYE